MILARCVRRRHLDATGAEEVEPVAEEGEDDLAELVRLVRECLRRSAQT